ncbi:MAG: hypothetical protein ACLPJW_03150, partial [Rhodomicrobium sp.]
RCLIRQISRKLIDRHRRQELAKNRFGGGARNQGRLNKNTPGYGYQGRRLIRRRSFLISARIILARPASCETTAE